MATSSQQDTEIQRRLRRIEGQVRGIGNMLASGEPCEDVVTQIFAARAALDGVATEVLRCQVEEVINSETAQAARERLMRLIALLRKV